MTKPHVIRKVRKNEDFVRVTRELDRLGIPWVLQPPKSDGHPYLEFAGLRQMIAGSPSCSGSHRQAVSQLRRLLRQHNIIREGE